MTSVWEDVRFDHVAAGELRDQLGATAVSIGEAMVAVEAEGLVASEGWQGGYHLDFLNERAAWSLLAGQLVASIEDTIVALARASDAALADQATRVALRDRLTLAGVAVVGPSAPGGGSGPGG